MQKKEARIYIEDGIVVGAFVSDPEISVSVVDYDRDIDKCPAHTFSFR